MIEFVTSYDVVVFSGTFRYCFNGFIDDKKVVLKCSRLVKDDTLVTHKSDVAAIRGVNCPANSPTVGQTVEVEISQLSNSH